MKTTIARTQTGGRTTYGVVGTWTYTKQEVFVRRDTHELRHKGRQRHVSKTMARNSKRHNEPNKTQVHAGCVDMLEE